MSDHFFQLNNCFVGRGELFTYFKCDIMQRVCYYLCRILWTVINVEFGYLLLIIRLGSVKKIY